MNRRTFLKITTASGGCLLYPDLLMHLMATEELKKSDFGNDFLWGVATAAYQIEGAATEDGKGPSIWDTFTHQKRKIKTGETGDIACDFYHRYTDDIALIKKLNFDVFRFSIAWSRIFPEGTGKVNQKGIDFYHRVIDRCLELNIQPWITLYHWDLPQALQDKGGWPNRDIIHWFSGYADTVTRAYGDKVKNWMVLNEPAAFTALGYLLGIHAPGIRSLRKFLASVHHACMCQAQGGRIIKANVRNANAGTTFSCSWVDPRSDREKDVKAAKKVDVMVNRLYIEPLLGMGYPVEDLPSLLGGIGKYIHPGDEDKLKFDFDFIGLQNYTRIIARKALWPPLIWANQVKPEKIEGAELTEMHWEVYPEGIYKILKQFNAYEGVNKIIITENGAAFPDRVEGGRVHDPRRIRFFKDYLKQVLRAKQEGINVQGYYVWTLMDNFEWAEGYRPRFGIVYVDFKTQQRIVKDSGWWFRSFLNEEA